MTIYPAITYDLSLNSLVDAIERYKKVVGEEPTLLVVSPANKFLAEELTHGGPLKVKIIYALNDRYWLLCSGKDIFCNCDFAGW
jgi:hypothetical protein